ncbi:MAG: alpha-amylase family glycosyl hydrolase [bacterium]
MTRFLALFLVLAACSSDDSGVPESSTRPVRACGAEIRYEGSGSDVSIAGDFSDWEALPLEKRDGVWQTVVAADPGDYPYTVTVDGNEVTPPASAPTQWYEGKEVWSLPVANCELPAWRVSSIKAEDGEIRAEFEFESAHTSRATLDPASVIITAAGQPVPAESITTDPETGRVVLALTPPTPGKYSLTISGSDSDGIAAENDGLWLPVWLESVKFTWQDALMYLAFTDRFRDSDGVGPMSPDNRLSDIARYQGGDFDGVLEVIESNYFEEMGVNALWLSPVYENPDGAFEGRDGALYTGFHGYWPIDPLSAESSYGGDEALRRVIKAAHARGIRIVFDVVLNQVHQDHVYCKERPEWCATTCVCGTENCDWEGPNGRTLDCQFAPYLPDLNYRNPELVERVLDDVLALMKKFDVDGLRVDAAKHMDHVIMRRMRQRLDALEQAGAAPFYLVGETFTGDRGLIMNYVSDDELHGQFDFPLFYGIRGTFVGNGSFRDLDASAAASQRSYGTALEWMSPFFGNHDVARIATEIAGNGRGPFGETPDLMANGPMDTITEWNIINRMSMAFAFVLTQPGVPLIYYGDEVGLAGDADPDNRRMMPTTLNANQTELLNRVKQLGVLRSQIPVLRHGTRKELWLDDSMYVYVRAGEAGDAAIIAMNKGESARTESVTIPAALGLAGKTLKGANNPDRSFSVIDGAIQLQLNPWEYVILTPQ